MLDPAIAARLKRDASGLVAAIAQQHDTGEVLMLGWMDDEALHRTLTTGRCTYWSRSRQEYWVKGDTSGHYQWVKSVALDCDRRPGGQGRPGRRRLPHRRPDLLRRGRAAQGCVENLRWCCWPARPAPGWSCSPSARPGRTPSSPRP